jgi:hypothetical protein
MSSSRSQHFQLRFELSFWGLLLAVLITPPAGRGSQATIQPPREYKLRFYHTHTNERLEVVYRRGGATSPRRWPGWTIFCAITAPGMFVTSTRACLTCCMT